MTVTEAVATDDYKSEAFTLTDFRRPNPAYLNMSQSDIYDQIEFFQSAFEEVTAVKEPKKLRGPHYVEIAGELEAADELLREIHPGLRNEHLLQGSYRSREAAQEYREFNLTNEEDWLAWKIGKLKLQALADLGEKNADQLDGPQIEEGVLAQPPYCYQGDGDYSYYSQGCFNACFRMVFAGITGEFPHEHAVRHAVQRTYHSHLTEDDNYLKIFNTPTYQQAFPEKTVSAITITGASLALINKLVKKIVLGLPLSEVSCIVNLQSEVADDIWHTNVLLGASDSKVVVHDPSSEETGAAARVLDTTAFHRRWAVAFNRAHLIITK